MSSTATSSSASGLSVPASQWWDEEEHAPSTCWKGLWGHSRSARTPSIHTRRAIFVAIGVSLGLLVVAAVAALLYMGFVLRIKDRAD
ncbi:hypothetical protein K438DRAFT_1974391 [Mycena galopus ATCC 62051]|nr:hypothetical protein K438DRAFT_1974391 [Mycena galopus ATCC 62051]